MRHLLLALPLILSACGDGSSSSSGSSTHGPFDTIASCDTRTNNDALRGECRDWSSPSGTVDLTVSCSGLNGIYAASTCPTTSRVGSCAINPVLGVTSTYRYYSTTYNASSAQTQCTSLTGTFTPN